jgi:hypothetical protein
VIGLLRARRTRPTPLATKLDLPPPYCDDFRRRPAFLQPTAPVSLIALAHARSKPRSLRPGKRPWQSARNSDFGFRARSKDLSDLDYLNRVRDIRDQMVRRDTTDLPEPVREDPLARAFYGCIHEALRTVDGARPPGIQVISADAAQCIVEIINTHRRVDWAASVDVENAIKNDIDDYVFDVIRGEHGVAISPEGIDTLVDQLLMVARRQAV